MRKILSNIVAIIIVIILAALVILGTSHIMHWLWPGIFDSPSISMVVF